MSGELLGARAAKIGFYANTATFVACVYLQVSACRRCVCLQVQILTHRCSPAGL